MMPFDAEELAYIAALDARADCEMLARELPALRPECGRILQVSTALLQAGAAAGLRCEFYLSSHLYMLRWIVVYYTADNVQ